MQTMLFQAAIFDLDGTLVDSLRDLAETANSVLAGSGFSQHPIDAYRYFVGDGVSALVRRMLPASATEEQCHRCQEQFTDSYARNWRINSCPYPGIRDMLLGLKNFGVKIAVLSNKPHGFTRDFVEYFFPEHVFAAVFGQRPEVARKPSPQGAIEIAALMRLAPSQCLYIGDTAIDMQTGRSAGMFTIGVLWGFRDRRELEEHYADLIVEQPLEIVDYVLRTN